MGAWQQKSWDAIASVVDKLSDGRYPTVETACLCGVTPPSETQITKVDRYGIQHRMVMCDYCTLMRANPRMTEAAYQEFYNTEYRVIYDGLEYAGREDDDDFLFGKQLERGIDLKAFLKSLEVSPKVIIEIGSNLGGCLKPWQEEGVTVYGVEIYERGIQYAAGLGIETVRTIEELIERGIKADLIIATDFIEHLVDPLRELDKWKELLAPKGRLFIYTPGFLAIPPTRAFQNAHTFQFIGATVDMVMRRLGYTPDFIDDRSLSLWRYCGLGMTMPPLPSDWRKYVVDHLEQNEKRAIPPVWTQCKFTEREMLENLEINLALKLPHFDELRDTRSGPCIIISGGPSVDGQVSKIKELQALGYPVFVIERMYPWATQNGIRVDYVVNLDASPGVESGFTDLQPDAIHIIAATTRPSVPTLLKNHSVYIWSTVSGTLQEAIDLWKKHGYKRLTVVNTGGSVGLGATTLAIMLGFRNLHIFGLDCMVSKDSAYAKGIAGESVERSYFEVETGGEKVLTCSAFLAFAQQFFSMMEIARKWGMLESVDIYGESLVKKMAATPWNEWADVHKAKEEMEHAHGA